MGSPTFYWYPHPDSTSLQTLSLGEGLGELFTDWQIVASDGEGIDGAIFRSVGLYRQIVTIQRDRMTGGESLGHKLASIQNHLDRGYSVGFSADADKAWFAPVNLGPISGDTSIDVGGNPFKSIVGNNTPANDDYIAIETGSPGTVHEIVQKSSGTIGATTGGTMIIANGCAFTYTNTTAYARWYRYWPLLKRPASEIGTNMVSNEHGLLWSLSVRLVVDTAALFRFVVPDKVQEFAFPEKDDPILVGTGAGGRVTPDFPEQNEYYADPQRKLNTGQFNFFRWGS